MDINDYIVVGSGCTGAMAAQTLTESGVKVLMLDVGIQNNNNQELIADTTFKELRSKNKNQHEYFLGKNFQSVPWNELSTGAQLTPSRRYMIDRVNDFLPFVSKTFFPMESLALGGLGNGWGLGCCVFSDNELKKMGLDLQKMKLAYQVVADRIGISSSNDDAMPYTFSSITNTMNSIDMDANAKFIFNTYDRKRKTLNRSGFFLGRPALALLTEDKEQRKKYQYRDLDFYSDYDESAYRPWITINLLKKKPNFKYVANQLVMRFEEVENIVHVFTKDIESKEEKVFYCRKLILCSSVISTARVVLRSFKQDEKKLPILTNYYSYIPSVNLKMLGKPMSEKPVGFAQLSVFYDKKFDNSDVSMASVYSYNSLMHFRIIKEIPLAYKEAFRLTKYLLPAFSIWGIHQPEEYTSSKYIELIKDSTTITGDILKADYFDSEADNFKREIIEKKYIKTMRKLGCIAIKKINPGNGSSIHYAGTLPFSKTGKPFTLNDDGRLNTTQNIYVADGSGFTFLPAKGLTLSLMANAHNVALGVLKNG